MGHWRSLLSMSLGQGTHLTFYLREILVHTKCSIHSFLQAASLDAQTLFSTVQYWEVSTIVWLVTFTAAWLSPQGLVIVTRTQEAVTEGGTRRAVAVKPATTRTPIVVIDVFNLLISAGFSCPLFRLKYILFTSWNSHFKSLEENLSWWKSTFWGSPTDFLRQLWNSSVLCLIYHAQAIGNLGSNCLDILRMCIYCNCM